MTVDYRFIGSRVKEARKEMKITQENLAELLDVSIGYVSQVERGATKISLDLLGAISGILKKDLSYFVREAGTESPHYMISNLTKDLEHLSEENRRIITTTVKAMLEEQN